MFKPKHLSPKTNARMQRQRCLQASFGDCGIFHRRIKGLLVVWVGGEERLTIALWPTNYSRQLGQRIPRLTSRIKALMLYKTVRKNNEVKGIFASMLSILLLFLSIPTDPILQRRLRPAPSTVHASAVAAYTTPYLQLLLCGTQVSPFDIFLARQSA